MERRMRKYVLLGLVVLVVSGCSITQTVNPVGNLATSEVCIIENSQVREGFLPELKNVLQTKNAQVYVLGSDATTSSCPIVLTYIARWKWDLAMYMSYAEINVYRDGQVVGNALYDATSGGGRMDKFIDAEPKIRELVNQLFPSNFPDVPGSREVINGKATVHDSNSGDANNGETESKPDLYDELKKLDELRKSGILTDEEFDVQKRKLLDET
jgi:hypothetical protein